MEKISFFSQFVRNEQNKPCTNTQATNGAIHEMVECYWSQAVTHYLKKNYLIFAKVEKQREKRNFDAKTNENKGKRRLSSCGWLPSHNVRL